MQNINKDKIDNYIEILRDHMNWSPCDCDYCQALEAGVEALEIVKKDIIVKVV